MTRSAASRLQMWPVARPDIARPGIAGCDAGKRHASVVTSAVMASALAALLLPAAVRAATLEVGPGRAYDRPSAAARAAQDGDTVAIDPGDYYDCAVWTRSHLLIAGTGPGVVITDTICQGKALFLLRGNDITIRNITFARARVADRNGAGIRAEGRNLTVQSSRFIDNEVGLLDGGLAGSTVRIVDCTFTANGVRDTTAPSPALSIGAIAALDVEGSRFIDSRGGVHILSSAAHTELVGNRIEDGEIGVRDAPVVLANGGTLVMDGNQLRRGPNAARINAAVRVDAGTGSAGELAFRRNVLVNASGRPAVLLLDWSHGNASFAANVLGPGDVERSTGGYWRHLASETARGLYSGTRHLAGAGLARVQQILANAWR